MAEVIVLHVTDIHIKSSIEEIVPRAAAIGSALARHFDTGIPVILALGGDIAWSAQPSQYELADKLISSICTALNTAGYACLGTCVAPGNHDCDYSLQNEEERLAICAGAQDIVKAKSLFNSLAVVQKPFKDFLYLVGSDAVELAPTLRRTEFTTDIGLIQVDALNTAWGSIKNKSEGHLPFYEIDLPRITTDTINILIAHHPPNWFMQQHKTVMQRWIDETYDIVLYGHEHFNEEHERRSRQSGATTSVVAGSAFFSEARAKEDGFSVVVLQRNGGTKIRQAAFRWGSGKYTLQGAISEKDFLENPAKKRPKRSFKKEFLSELEEPGVQLAHPEVSRPIQLSELYVEPILSRVSPAKPGGADTSKLLFATEVLRADSSKEPLSIIFGPEQCGKTSMCKQLTLTAQADGFVPLWLEVSLLQSSNAGEITAWVNRAICDSYVGEHEVFYQSDISERIIFLDGLNNLRGKPSGKIALVDKCSEIAGRVIVTVSASSATEGLLFLTRGDQRLPQSELYEFPPMSRSSMTELIGRWLGLGQAVLQKDDDIEPLCRQMTSKLSSMLGRHGLPPYPLSVLLLLQLAEAMRESSAIMADGSIGYIMESLIVNELQRNGIRIPVGVAMGYLGEFSWFLEKRNVISVDEKTFSEFHEQFSKNHELTVDEASVKRGLSAARFLTIDVGLIRFRYPYLSHFFLAKHLSMVYTSEEANQLVDQLITYVHTEKAASVLTFLAHFSIESDLIDKLLVRARNIHLRSEKVDFWAGSAMFGRFNSAEDRQKLISYESADTDADIADEELDHDSKSDGEITQTDMFPTEDDPMGWASSLKLIHILGQILRSRSTRMDATQKSNVANACLDLGMRTLGYAFAELTESAPGLVHASSKAFEKLLDVNREKAMRHANSFLGWFIVAISCTYIYRFGRACGAEEFSDFNSRMYESTSDDSEKLFWLSARLLGERVVVETELVRMYERAVAKDLLPTAILRRLARYRLHVSPPEEGQKWRLARKLGLGIATVAPPSDTSK